MLHSWQWKRQQTDYACSFVRLLTVSLMQNAIIRIDGAPLFYEEQGRRLNYRLPGAGTRKVFSIFFAFHARIIAEASGHYKGQDKRRRPFRSFAFRLFNACEKHQK